LPRVAKAVSRQDGPYEYLAESIADWPDQVRLGRMLRGAGWDEVAYRNLSGGIVALHRGSRPEPSCRALRPWFEVRQVRLASPAKAWSRGKSDEVRCSTYPGRVFGVRSTVYDSADYIVVRYGPAVSATAYF